MKTVIMVLAIIFIACCLMVAAAAFAILGELAGTFAHTFKERQLESHTAKAKLRLVKGTVSGREYRQLNDLHIVKVRLSAHTTLDFDDEDAYYVIKNGSEVSVRIREHFDKNGSLIARVPIEILAPL